MKTIDLFDADHPYRKIAIDIIERVIEPLVSFPIEGKLYYTTEDVIVDIISVILSENENNTRV